tara:strand:- start:248 stop:421 length:174 start_codon:yes stop_codon:yes gene_type:complete
MDFADILPIAFYYDWHHTINKRKIMLTISEIILASSVFLVIIYFEVRLLYAKSKAAK